MTNDRSNERRAAIRYEVETVIEVEAQRQPRANDILQHEYAEEISATLRALRGMLGATQEIFDTDRAYCTPQFSRLVRAIGTLIDELHEWAHEND